MSGRRLVLAFAAFLLVFAAALTWTQLFAYYQRQRGVAALDVGGQPLPVADYDGIAAASSPLKLRACLRLDPAALAGLPPAADATPLNAPFWFRCFSARALTRDIASGGAKAYRIAHDDPPGFDLMLAVYPDARGYLWRQLTGEYRD
jgi:hypothetical protein